MQHLSPSLPARRTRGRILVLALVVALCALMGTANAEPRKARPARAAADPLLIHLDTISPATLSDEDEPLTITGTITNESAEQWTGINLYSIRSAAPIVDAQTLAASARIAADEFVGLRVTTAGTEATVDVLDPGQTADFSLTVPRSELAISAPGVYWLGVQALGDSSVPRDTFADGRARTFIPIVPRASKKDLETVETALVLPVRETVWFTPGGRIDRVKRWSRSLEEGGRLDSILDAGDPATGAAVTWLVDPAVLAAVSRLKEGNPARSLAPDPAATPVEPTAEPPETTPSASAGGAPGALDPFAALADPIPPVDPDEDLTPEEEEVAALAQAWLDRFNQVTAGQTVLALPYGDIDASAAVAHGPSYYAQAVTRSSQVMTWLNIASTPALAPRDGFLSPAAIEAAAPETTILLADTSFAQPPAAPESMVRLLGHKVVVTSSGASSGGPSPTAADDPLALRQRLLSEAALRLQSETRSPVVTMLPADWKPTGASALFDGLDVPWLEQVSVAELGERRAVSMNRGDLRYTDEDQAAELGVTNFTVADQLTARGNLLAGLLTQQNLVRQQIADEVLASLSSGHRPNATRAAASVRDATDFVHDQLGSVTVDAPDAITLSSDSGRPGVDIINRLDQPVTVRIAVQSDGSLELEDLGPQQIGADSRTRIKPNVTANRPGIHQVRLVVTDAQGTATGASTSVQIRAAQVSGLIWLLLAGGATLLFGTIAIRLVRRIRSRGATTSEPAA